MSLKDLYHYDLVRKSKLTLIQYVSEKKTKKTTKSASSNPERSYDELQKKYEVLQKDHEQQHQQRNGSLVSTHSLARIHERYDHVMKVMMENQCSLACAFGLAICPRSTVRDFVAIAELKKVDPRELDIVLHDQQVASVKQLEALCRRRLRRFIPVMENMRREGKLLPLKFNQRFYE